MSWRRQQARQKARRPVAKEHGSHKEEITAIRKLASALGGIAFTMHQVGRLCGSAGVPDMYLMFPRLGKSVWMEVKVGKDKLRAAQIAFKVSAAESGAEVLVGGVAELSAWHPDCVGTREET